MEKIQKSTRDVTQRAMALYYDGALKEAMDLIVSELHNNGSEDGADRAHLLAVKGQLMSHEAFLMSSSADDAIAVLSNAIDLAETHEAEESLALGLCYRGFGIYTNTFHNNIGEYKDAMPDLTRSIEINENIGNMCGLAHALVYEGILYERTEDVASAKANYDRAAQVAQEHKCELEESYAVRHLAFLRQGDGDFEGAKGFFERSLELRQKVGFRTGLALAHFSLGNVLFDLEQHEEASVQIEKARALAEDFDLDRVITLCDYLMGEIFAAQGQIEEAIQALEKSRIGSEEIGYAVGVERAANRIAELKN